MKYRIFGKTNWKISEVSLGTWQVGGGWGGQFDSEAAQKILETAIENGVNFLDTADVYDDGLSEKAVGKAVQAAKKAGKTIYVASKCGRRLNPHNSQGYNRDNLRRFIEDSLERLQMNRLNLIQLHCPPNSVYYQPEVFEILEAFQQEGLIEHYGVSVEKVEEGLKALEYPGLTSIQMIFNIFRQRPAAHFLQAAAEKKVAVLARVPLASGLLSGKIDTNTQFDPGDHRLANRNGEWFDVGETFGGIPLEAGIEAVKKIEHQAQNRPLSEIALRWILDHPQITTVIPGASKPEQVLNNTKVSDTPTLTAEMHEFLRTLYAEHSAPWVHHRW